jgi:rubrerythrin
VGSSTIDFAALDLQDALDLAILVEEEAQERYVELVDQMEMHHTKGAATFFAAMARNEQKHGDELRARRRALFGDAPRRVQRGQLWDVEAPGFDEVRIYMTARQAMETALHCEVKAHEFFVNAIPHIADADVKKLFQELRDEEVLHQALVREAMRNLAPEPDAPATDYEDEPVGH